MKMLRNFKCPNDHVSEELVESDTLTILCAKCDEVALKMISAPRSFSNTTGKSPSSKYTKQR